jgi:glycosyltransferase involved in cell wall biosynthesis
MRGVVSMRVAALIPAYCEERFIADVARRTCAQLADVLIVDDGSPDETAELARSAGAEVIRHEVNQGKGAAIQTGLRALAARGFDYILILDADGQHLPEEIRRFVETADREHTKLLVGNRMGDTHEMPWQRRLTNQFMSSQISLLCGQRVEDTQCGFRMLHRDLVPLLLGRSGKFDYETEMLILASWQGYRISSVPISTVYGEETSSIHPVRDTLRFLRLMARYWWKRLLGAGRRRV